MRHQKLISRISCFLLCLVMVLALMPTTAFATGGTQIGSSDCEYVISGNTLTIRPINGTGTLPSTYDSVNGYYNTFENILDDAGDTTAVNDSSITKIVISSGVQAGASTGSLFRGFSHVVSFDLSGLDTSNTTDMSSMFEYCQSLQSIDLSMLNTSQVTNMSCMFEDCADLTSVNVSGINTANVIYLTAMFRECSSLVSINLSGLNTSSVTNINALFLDCPALTTVNFSGWNTSNFQNAGYSFENCIALETLDLTDWDLSNVTYTYRLFAGCTSLKTIYAGSSWPTGSSNYGVDMFTGCSSLVGGNGTTCDGINNVKNTYAVIDSDTTPGYLTLGPAPVSAPIASTGTSSYIRCDVTFDVQGHGTAPEMQREKSGHTISEPEEPKADGYVFAGWYKEPACENIWNFSNNTVHTDITLYAKWVSPDYEEVNPETGELSDEFIRVMTASIILLTLFTVSFASVYGKKRSHR